MREPERDSPSKNAGGTLVRRSTWRVFAANHVPSLIISIEPNNEKARISLRSAGERGGDVRIRTADPLHAKQVLYQLSYTPTGSAGEPVDRRKYDFERLSPSA